MAVELYITNKVTN